MVGTTVPTKNALPRLNADRVPGRGASRVDNLKKHFAQTEKDLRELGTSTERIVKRGERILEVELEDQPAALPPKA